MSASRPSNVQLLDLETSFVATGARLWNNLLPDIVASDTTSCCQDSVVNSKHFYLDSPRVQRASLFSCH